MNAFVSDKAGLSGENAREHPSAPENQQHAGSACDPRTNRSNLLEEPSAAPPQMTQYTGGGILVV